MTFLEKIDNLNPGEICSYLLSVREEDVVCSLERDKLTETDLLNLLSPAAEKCLEQMARKANRLTTQHFGRTIGIYAPLYISDYCSNHCTYCGFNCKSIFSRKTLAVEEIEAEARVIYDMGIRHVLVLTGEAPERTPPEYLEEAIQVLKRYFSSIALEMFPMDESLYRRLIQAGADSLTVYQETYDRSIYGEVHPKGKKSDYAYRLATPERGARAGFRAINIGPLFGLGEPRTEAFMAGLHARYLEHEYPDVEVSISLPRMRHAQGAVGGEFELTDSTFVQIMTAWRLFMPRLGISISTRESSTFRDHLIHLGATRYSAGSRTDVGGYTSQGADTNAQFEVTDTRSVEQVCTMIRESGYQPVFKDWEHIS